MDAALRRGFGVLAFATAVLITLACNVTRITVSGSAMSPTYKDGDRLLASRDVTVISRGDVVAFRYPRDESKSFLQRVIGLPGERVEIRDGVTLVNGTPIEEPYVADANRLRHSTTGIVLGADEYFMMGDNRANSSDSRSWGPVKRSAIWARLNRTN